MGDNRDFVATKEIAHAASLGLESKKLVKCRSFIKILTADFRKISNAKKTLCRLSETDKGDSDSLLMWLTDNYYLIENEYAVCKKDLNNSNRIPCTGEFPRVSRAFMRFSEYADFPIDSVGISAVIDALNNNYTLSVDEYFLLKPFAAFAFISGCSKVLSEYQRKKLSGFKLHEDKYTRSLGNLIQSLRNVSVHNFDSDILRSTPSKILSDDPSGDYCKMTDSTKIMYLGKLSEKAKKQGESEVALASEIIETAKAAKDERKRHVGYYLITLPKAPKYLYFSVIIGVPILLTALLLPLSPMFLFAILPLYEAVKGLSHFIFSKIIKSYPLPRMELSKIPDNAATLVVITSLITGEKSDGVLFDRLERIFRANGEKNIYFGILADIRDSKTAKAPGDEETVNHAYGRIDALCAKYGKKFMLFERRRNYSKSEEIFMGWERKRGAVCELVNFLRGESTTFTEKSRNSAMEILGDTKIKYVITLDADTNLGLGAARDMCSAMLHPLAKPLVDKKKGIVTEGYGIMQPLCSTDLNCAGATPFTEMMCGEGGSNIYAHAAFDVYQSIFGQGIFCGKGIFDVDAFYEVINLNNTFPEDMILSHDSLEGAKLSSALINDIELTDSFPKHPLSYLKRRHRWIRGDIQNLVYLFPKIRFSKKDVRDNNISALSKFKLLDNAVSALVPVFSFVCIFCAMLSEKNVSRFLIAASLLYIAVPFLTSLYGLVSSFTITGITRRFFSKGVSTAFYQSFAGMVFTLAMLPMLALSSLDAVMKGIYRSLISKKKLLEWQTAAGSDAVNAGMLMYLHKNIFCAFAGFLLFAFSGAGFLRLLAVIWFAYPVLSYHTCFRKNKKDSRENKEYSEKSAKYASDIWNFFRDCVTEKDNFLPPDNIQLAPQEAVAHRTSPTNIGLYLLSVLCAADFGFIDTAELEKRLVNTVSTMEKLEKWKGHLYNWYDTETLAVLPPYYISTVDSGNLTACLITLRMGLRDYVSESTSLLELIKRIEKLEEDTDYGVLYNSERKLFSLGADVFPNGEYKVNEGCYDLMMSEARTISYIQCAKRSVPKKHWTSLSRALVSSDGYIGLSSWTGTAFEYFMPAIFLPVYKRSLYGEAMQFAMREQEGRRATRRGKAIFGISESGYFSFDSEMNYRYKAFGIPSLALKSGLEKELVISPYSSFLGLLANKRKAFSNLDTMSELGLYGKYGLYEAVDFTKGRCPENGSVVKSYMSHHMGMSLCALCNTAFDNILCKRFMSDSAMNCARELLEEKIPVNAVVRKLMQRHGIPSKPVAKSTDGKIYTRPELSNPNIAMLSNGSSGILVSSSGHAEMTSDGILVNHCDFDKYECTESLFCFARIENKTVCATPLPKINPSDTEYSMKCTGGSITNIAKISGLCDISESFSMSRHDSTVFCVKLELALKQEQKKATDTNVEFAFFFTPVIAKKQDYLAHTSFSSLFVYCDYLKDEKILIYKRRPRNENEKQLYLGVALSDISSDFSFCARQDAIFASPMTASSFSHIFSDNRKSNKTGALIRPCCKITVFPERDMLNCRAELLICKSDSQEKLISSIELARQMSFSDKVMKLSEISDKFCSGAGIGLFGSDKSRGAVEELLSGYVFGNLKKQARYKDNLQCFSLNTIWKNGISGDIPIAAVSLVSAQLVSKLEKYIRAVKLLRLLGLRMDLCIIYSERERYSRPVYNEIWELLGECDCRELVSKGGGGVFLIDRSLDAKGALALLDIAHIKLDILYESGSNSQSIDIREIRLPVTNPVLSADFPIKEEKLISLSHGDFSKSGFTVRKDREFRRPFSHILPGRRLCSLVTHNSLGYTWVSNAQNRRITPFRDNPSSDMNGERILLSYGTKLYDLCAMARYVTFSQGTAIYRGIANGVLYTVTAYVSEKLCVKHCDVSLKFPKGSGESAKLMYLVTPVMGRHTSEALRISYSVKDNILCFKNPFSEFFGMYTGFITAVETDSEQPLQATKYITDKADIFTKGTVRHDNLCECACVALSANRSDEYKNYRFILGAFEDGMKSPKETVTLALSEKDEMKSSVAFANSLIPKIRLLPQSNNMLQTSYSVLFNFFLPYQNAAGRFIARSGFYQSSGAYGFRDQLQDSLCLMYSRPDMTKAHIYRCCTRQFPQGDVLHWWHECEKKERGEIVCKGVRTLCSDDYLWLPYAAAEYFSFSGDRDFLLKRVHFADGDGLHEDTLLVREKYLEIRRSTESDTVYGHCKRSLDRAISRLGERGLPLIGSCDWCDGYSDIGTASDGESVWLGMFLCIVLEKFCTVCRKMSDSEALDRYSHARLELINSLEKYGYSESEGQYIRAYFPNGEKLGSLESEECKTDLLPQCFAPFVSSMPTERLYSLMENTFQRLYDNDYNIFRLFSPPFDKSSQKPGYIKGYVSGIRENGGQYTHAAVWGAMGLCAASDILYRSSNWEYSEKIRGYAKKASDAQNTVLRHLGYLGEKAKNAYNAEPYYLAGDIYSNKNFKGYAGWTIYTGSASWYYRLILEYLFGIRLYDTGGSGGSLKILCDTPYINRELCEGAIINLELSSDCIYEIEFKCGNTPKIILDSEDVAGKIRLSPGKHKITVIRPY